LKDFIQPAGFDAKHVAEIQIFNTGNGDGSFFLDDITFDNCKIELLKNGNFAACDSNWILERNNGAAGKIECVKEGPDGKDALRLKVLTISDALWHLQLYQKVSHIVKGATYSMTFWVKSDRTGDINVNCMQNHEPWDHRTQQKMSISTEWKQLRFTFVGAWNDDDARVCFTNLGTTPGQVYWFADCSLVQTALVSTQR
jgi:hypothetical protein